MNTTTKSVINSANQNDIISFYNESAGWHCVSRGNIHMITFFEGKWRFTKKGEVNKFYKTRKSFASRVAQLLNRGY